MIAVDVHLRGYRLRRYFADVAAATPFVQRWIRAGLVIFHFEGTR